MKIIQRLKNKISPYSPRSLHPAEIERHTCFICLEECNRKYLDKSCNCSMYCHKKCNKEYNKQGSFTCPVCRTELIDKRINKYLVKLKQIFTRRSRRITTAETHPSNEMEEIFEEIRQIMRRNEENGDDEWEFDREAFKGILMRLGAITCFILFLAL